MDELESLLDELNSISSLDDADQLHELDRALTAIFANPNRERAVDTLFHLLERFPEDDSYGLFWSVLHGLEDIKGYEDNLIVSLRRQPSEFSLRMVNRIINVGIIHIGDTNLPDLLESISNDASQSPKIRDWARGYVEWQRQGGLSQN